MASPDIFTQRLGMTSPVMMLAPMEGISNSHFRAEVAALGGVDFVATEFIRIAQLKQKLEQPIRCGVPLQIQFMASDGAVAKNFIRRMKDVGYLLDDDWLDLNVGCPSRRVNARGAGAALLERPKELMQLVDSLRSEHRGPFSIKTRVTEQPSSSFPQLLKELAHAPIDFITIHPRVRCQHFEAPLHHDLLQLAVATLPYPVIANGDIFDAGQGVEILKTTRVRGLMCGRGVVQNPYLLRQLKVASSGKQLPVVSARELYAFAFRLLERFRLDEQNGRKRLGTAKEFFVWFSKNPLIQAGLFNRLKRSSSLEELILFFTEEVRGDTKRTDCLSSPQVADQLVRA